MRKTLACKIKSKICRARRIKSAICLTIPPTSLDELRKWLAFHLEFMLYAARQPELTERWNQYASKALLIMQEIKLTSLNF